ncbi:hypothetical protein R76727_02090 [Ralstonia mannitolilytica]|nr:hypothetical protein R76727_02090 [Ralstonia mannitolilytica]
MAENNVEFKGKGQALRLGIQQELGGGPLSIFGAAAQKHDLSIREVTAGVLTKLAEEFPNLEFRQRTSLSKKEINEKLRSFDPRLGRALFVESASIRPEGMSCFLCVGRFLNLSSCRSAWCEGEAVAV